MSPQSVFLVSLAVAFAAAPAHGRASSNAPRNGEGRPCAVAAGTVKLEPTSVQTRTRAAKLPAKHKLRRQDTGDSLSDRYYGSHGGALTILWRNGLKKWRPSRKIVESQRYDVDDTIVIPKLPKATVNPPARAAADVPAFSGERWMKIPVGDARRSRV